ncbi:hypothetical protein CDEF62S_06097 [Castellaniella defragrans]
MGFGSRDASYADESGIPGGYPDPSAERSAIVVEANPSYRGAGGSAAPLLRADSPPSVWRPVARFFGSLLIVVLVLLFVAQLVYVYRGQVAQFVPGVRPWLEQACVPLRCRVPYARDISQISITGSALKVADRSPRLRRRLRGMRVRRRLSLPSSTSCCNLPCAISSAGHRSGPPWWWI